jgi:hypothetical protein
MKGRKSSTANLNNKCVSERTGRPKWWPLYAREVELIPNNKMVYILRVHL